MPSCVSDSGFATRNLYACRIATNIPNNQMSLTFDVSISIGMISGIEMIPSRMWASHES